MARGLEGGYPVRVVRYRSDFMFPKGLSHRDVIQITAVRFHVLLKSNVGEPET